MSFKQYEPKSYPHDIGYYWVQSMLGQLAVVENRPILEKHFRGSLAPGKTLVSLNTEMESLGWSVFYDCRPAKVGEEREIIWTDPHGQAALYVAHTESTGALGGTTTCTTEEAFSQVEAIIRTFVGKKITSSKAYVLATSDDGPYLHEVGTAGEKMERGNYRPETMKALDHAIEDFKKPISEACGQVLILDGPPGTGKTRLCRGIIKELPKALIILVQSNMITQLGSPQFIPVLQRSSRPGQPIVLLIEDADECLSKRASDNMSEISAVLNFGDGILGSMIDIRIIATTNMDIKDLDAAVLREGRLCRRIEVGLLEPEQAEAVYRRIGGTEDGLFTKEKFYTLAKCYSWARNVEEAAEVKGAATKRTMGFVMEAQPKEETDEPEPDNYGLGLHPGEVGTTDRGEMFRVRKDGELEILRNGLDDLFDDDDDDDSDLIDEDP